MILSGAQLECLVSSLGASTITHWWDSIRDRFRFRFLTELMCSGFRREPVCLEFVCSLCLCVSFKTRNCPKESVWEWMLVTCAGCTSLSSRHVWWYQQIIAAVIRPRHWRETLGLSVDLFLVCIRANSQIYEVMLVMYLSEALNATTAALLLLLWSSIFVYYLALLVLLFLLPLI